MYRYVHFYFVTLVTVSLDTTISLTLVFIFFYFCYIFQLITLAIIVLILYSIQYAIYSVFKLQRKVGLWTLQMQLLGQQYVQNCLCTLLDDFKTIYINIYH